VAINSERYSTPRGVEIPQFLIATSMGFRGPHVKRSYI
jgi:hypothetical protein